ncbi:alpha/beta hydrolase [soil metagenome]
MLTSFILGLMLIPLPRPAFAEDGPQQIPLWPNGAPGFEGRRNEPEQAKDYWIKNIHNPSITAYLPAGKSTGAAVLVCPGGGHRELVFNAEGRDAAKFLNSIGVAAFVLKYRPAREPNSPPSLQKHPREDAHQALRLIRSRASEWRIDPNRVGMLGFSAGGEVVSVVAYESGKGDPAATDPIDRLGGKPDFQMLVYPGPLGVPDVLPKDAPPAFLLVANDDRGAARVVASILQKYRTAGASVEAHIYARGGHAFNMGNRSKLATLKSWPQRMTDWLSDNYILDPEQRIRDEQKAKPGQGKK